MALLHSTIDLADRAFYLGWRGQDARVLELMLDPAGSHAAPTAIWSRRFDKADDGQLLLDATHQDDLDPVFLGRLTMMFGSAALDALADSLVAKADARRAAEIEEAAKHARDHLVVELFRREGKHGRHLLELERRSETRPEWSVAYDRAIERDRLCDWMRWQRDRFSDFLHHAAEHGAESLSRQLVDEMFATERRVKKEGRGAGGMRPLRMWRGD